MDRAFPSIPPEHEALVTQCIGCAITVHRELGPGFREVIYKRAYCLELDANGLRFEVEKDILVPYRQWVIPGQRLDLLVGGAIIVELKAVPKLSMLDQKQLLSYMRATGVRVELLFNFHASLLREGMRRFVI